MSNQITIYDGGPSTAAPSAHATAMRGLGRAAYRAGKLASQSIPFARTALGHELEESDRGLVLAGWRSERSESITWESPAHLL